VNLSFIPMQKTIAVVFEPGVDTGSRKAPQQHPPHFYSEIRLNPDAKALVLRPRVTLTRYATEWQPNHDDRYVIEETGSFGFGIYRLMDWDNSRAYTIPGTVITPQASHFKYTAGLRSADTGKGAPDTVRIGDYYFNLKEAMPAEWFTNPTEREVAQRTSPRTNLAERIKPSR